MGVLKKDQRETQTFFLVLSEELCVEAGLMLGKRKKDRYYNSFAPKILDAAVNVLYEGTLGNSIMISKNNFDNDFAQRRIHFQNALGNLNLYEILIKIFVEENIRNKTFNKEKGYKFLNNNANKIVKIRSSITNILKSDINKVKNLRKNELTRQKHIKANIQQSYYEKLIKERRKATEKIQPIIFTK